MAVALAVIRGFTALRGADPGNFWLGLTRSVQWILLPLLVLLGLALVAQGTPQTLQGTVPATVVERIALEAEGHGVIVAATAETGSPPWPARSRRW